MTILKMYVILKNKYLINIIKTFNYLKWDKIKEIRVKTQIKTVNGS